MLEVSTVTVERAGLAVVRAMSLAVEQRQITERMRAWRRARLGVAHVEQNRAVFRELTVVDNLRAASPDDGSIESQPLSCFQP
jgi:ABC-type branched-subunit amino acid transport system ATPase component